MAEDKYKQFSKELIKNLKTKKKKIVLCHGVFDLVHYGHIKHFESAKKFGDVLFVSVTKDIYIKKGFGRPLFDQLKRIKFLKSLKVVDYVFLSEGASAEKSISLVKPDYYVKGPDYKDNKKDKTKKIYKEKKLVSKYGGKIVYTADEKFSSTKIINNNLFTFSEVQLNFLKNLKKNTQLITLLVR